MRPLWTVHRIHALHPAQIPTRLTARRGEIGSQRIATQAPLRPLIRSCGKAQVPPRTSHNVDRKQSPIRMIGIAQNLRTRAIRRDVPRVELHNRTDGAGSPTHPFQRVRPHRKHQVPRVAKERLMHHKLVVAVFIQTLQARAIPPHAMHPRRGVCRKFNPLGLQRMKLWMDHRSGKIQNTPLCPINPATHQPRRTTQFHSRSQPLAIRCKRTLPQLPTVKLHHQPLHQTHPVQHPNRPATHEHNLSTTRQNRWRIRMHRRAICQLPNLPIWKSHLEQLRLPAASIRREHQRPIVRRKRPLQKIRGMTHPRVRSHLMNPATRHGIQKL